MITVQFCKGSLAVIATWNMAEIPQVKDFIYLVPNQCYRVIGRIWKDNNSVCCIVQLESND